MVSGEIMNYVLSLQNQIGFLSMKIASLSPVPYDFNVDLMDCINQQQKLIRGIIQQPQPCVEQSNHLQSQAKSYENEAFTSYQLMKHATGSSITAFPSTHKLLSGSLLQSPASGRTKTRFPRSNSVSEYVPLPVNN